MMNIKVIKKLMRHVKHVVLEVSDYTSTARALARPVLAKLCSTAFSVESSTYRPMNEE
ncbi:hypothetical protein HPP92_006992 [Vanilla planifolia]|uniref:Uncharacterized protein n=1 Tax=Vanilla planifolia TaxID=51239 RepID=A0A835R9B7_VANPL|nr:hypothetical protein HPP92_006992 [Vanilla planifolia]